MGYGTRGPPAQVRLSSSLRSSITRRFIQEHPRVANHKLAEMLAEQVSALLYHRNCSRVEDDSGLMFTVWIV